MPTAPPDVDDDVPLVRTRVRGRRISRSWAKRRHLGWITFGSAVLVLALGLLFVVATWDHGRRPVSEQIGAAAPGTTAPASTAPASTAPASTGAAAGAPTGTASSTDSSPAVSGPAQTAVRGTIDAAGDSRYTMTSTTGLKYTVIVTPDTKFSRNRSFTSFGAGDHVAVKGTLADGIITATSVNPANAR